MITAEQIRERLEAEKDPLQYIDAEVAGYLDQMGAQCQSVQDTISAHGHRADESDQIDMGKIKEDLVKIGELYYTVNTYLKVRKEQAINRKRNEKLNRALQKREQWIEQHNKKASNE
jgi:hypothetical protein